MPPTNISQSRGRPRLFDPDQAVETAQQLFHTYGYDAVSVADVTGALGINPPSFYAAFGNKAGLYLRVLDRYAKTGAIALPDILRADRPVAECLITVLEEAARRYAANNGAVGCLVLEGTHSNDAGVRSVSCATHAAAEDVIRRYIAARHPEEAGRLTDFVSTTMSGMSARARNGQDVDRLLATARLAGLAIEQALPVPALS